MRKCHPDRARTACDRVNGEAWSAWINKAYHCLRDPFCRARHAYNIKCKCEEELEEEASGGMSNEELMEVLEKRELIESTEDKQYLQSLAEENEARINDEWQVLGHALDRVDCTTAKHLLNRLRYWQTLREACQNRLESMKS